MKRRTKVIVAVVKDGFYGQTFEHRLVPVGTELFYKYQPKYKQTIIYYYPYQ